MALQPGQTIGRYQIIEPLGTGGMATVYKAYQPSLEREVALKVLRAGFADDPEFFERFQREARSIAKLRHPHIVQIFDFEPLDGRYVLAMEFLDGGTLKERIAALAGRGERLPPAEVARIIGEVADALSYGHELSIVHRDVKPANVMLGRRDRAVVTDFGIAKIIGGEGQTQTGVGIGTPEYMAPEQASGAKIDHRADIYSLAVMAYEMLVGRVPFVADTPLAVVLAHVRDPLPMPSSIDPSINPETERVLLKALAKDPNDRYSTATEFADALKAALNVTTGPVTYTGITPALAAAAGAVATAAPAGAAIAKGRVPRLPRFAYVAIALVVLLVVGGVGFATIRGGGGIGGTGTALAEPTIPHGALLYELDRSAAGESQVTVTGRDKPPPATLVPMKGKFTGDALELDVPAGGNVNLSGVSGTSLTATYEDFVIQLRVAATSGLGRITLAMHSGTTGSLQVWVSPSTGELGIQTNNTTGQQVDALVPQAVRYAGRRTPIELVVSVRGRQVVAYVDGAEAAQATDPRPERSGGFYLNAGTGSSQPYNVKIVSFRIYAQPSGQAPQGGQPAQCGPPPQPPCAPASGIGTAPRGKVAQIIDVLGPNGYVVRSGASSFTRQPSPSTATPSGSALAATPPATGTADLTINLPISQSQFYADIDYAYPQSRSVATVFFFRSAGGNAYSLWILGGQSLSLRYSSATGPAGPGSTTDIQNVPIPTQLAAAPSGVATGATRLSLVADGQTFTVLMNGQQLMQVNDSRIPFNAMDTAPQLRVARLGTAPNESGTIVISNFQIYALAPR